jgi:hypothetical protein
MQLLCYMETRQRRPPHNDFERSAFCTLLRKLQDILLDKKGIDMMGLDRCMLLGLELELYVDLSGWHICMCEVLSWSRDRMIHDTWDDTGGVCARDDGTGDARLGM